MSETLTAHDGAPPLLELEGVEVHFPIRGGLLGRLRGTVRAVDGVSLHVAAGETLGLVGESGSGKSTLGRAALRLIEPTAGRVRVEGVDLTAASAEALRRHRRHLQMIFQDPHSSFDPRAQLAASVGEPLGTHFGLRGAARVARSTELLAQVGLGSEFLSRYPSECSGGQIQRVAIARALAVDPKLVVCDEPVSALDVSTQAQVIQLLEALQNEQGLSFLFVSHDLSVVRHVSHRIAVMFLGQLVEMGPAEEICERPRHPYTEALLSAIPIPDPVVQKSRERIVLQGDLPSPATPPDGCHFHTRCPYVMDVCRAIPPPQLEITGGVSVACHLHSEGPRLAGAPVTELRASAQPL